MSSLAGPWAVRGKLLQAEQSSFSPADIAGLWGWWDDASIVSSQGNVSAWNDKSGGGRNLTATACTLSDGVQLNGSTSFLTGGFPHPTPRRPFLWSARKIVEHFGRSFSRRVRSLYWNADPRT